MKSQNITDGKIAEATIPMLNKDTSVDCTDANAGMVLSYYRRGIAVFLPFEKFGPFLNYIRTMNQKARLKEDFINEKHHGKSWDNGVIIKMIT